MKGEIKLTVFSVKYFRMEFLPDNQTLANVSEIGYTHVPHRSKIATCFLQYVAEHEGLSLNFEYRIGRHTVDAYFEIGTPRDIELLGAVGVNGRICAEIIGCAWHGCSRCYADNDINPITKLANSTMMSRTQDRLYQIGCAGYTVLSIQTCIIEEMAKITPTLAARLKAAEVVPPLQPRKAFFGMCTVCQILYHLALNSGGFVSAFKRFYEVADMSKEYLSLVDIVSLYPTINFESEV